MKSSDHDRRSASQPKGRHGRYDLSTLHISKHALERFRERTQREVRSDPADTTLRESLRICRKIGTDPAGTVAWLGLHDECPFVVLVKSGTVVTWLTLEQFESVMSDFGRHRWPRRFGRWLRETRPGEPASANVEPERPA